MPGLVVVALLLLPPLPDEDVQLLAKERGEELQAQGLAAASHWTAAFHAAVFGESLTLHSPHQLSL